MQTPGGLTTHQTDHKPDRGGGGRKTERISPGSDCEALELSGDEREAGYFRGWGVGCPMVNLGPEGLLHI